VRRALFALLLLALATVGVGCPCVRSAVNANEGLRWWLFSNFGASRICPEVLKRGVPIKLGFDTHSIGRFFPQQCQVRVDDASRTIVMHAGGSGYAMLPLARRVGFVAYVGVEYRPDFRMEEDALYVWGRFNRLVTPPDLRLVGVENPVVSLATRTPLGDVATLLGNGLLANELGRGFTVVRQDDGDDFTLGILMPPAKPKRPFAPGRGRTLVAADPAVTIGAASREYLGPIEVSSGGAALYLKLEIQGAPLVWAVVTRPVGDAWRGATARRRCVPPART